MRRVWFYLIFFISNFAFGQEYPKDFGRPMKIELLTSGTFGELRQDHFHSGIDFSTSWKTGVPVYATADGVVNRIKVGTYGYGKAIYLRHSNGYTSVYAHLDKFEDSLQKYVVQKHYELQEFEIELFPTSNKISVKKGQLIGYSGNTGSSGGPHLHYEVRETATERPVNPMLFGMDAFIVDRQAPVINGIMVYPLRKNTMINNSEEPFYLSLNKIKDGDYRTETVYSDGVIGFGVNSYDTSDKSRGKNGLYHLKQTVNGSLAYEVIFDVFSFDDSRYVNAYLDYERLKLSQQRYQKVFSVSDITLPFVEKEMNKGQLVVEKGNSYNVVIFLMDFFNNQTRITIPVVHKSYPDKDFDDTKEHLKTIDYQRDYIFEEHNVYVGWNAYTFYNDVRLDIHLEENKVILHKDVVPVHENIDVRFNVKDMQIDKEKSFIGCIHNGKIRYFFTWKREDDFRIRTKILGTYQVFQDTIAPSVGKADFVEGKAYGYDQELSFEIIDDMSGIDFYQVFINEKWALFEYDHKTNKITHQLRDEIAVEGNNKVKIFVKDRVGNYTNFETHFQLH